MIIPENVQLIIDILEQNKFQAFIVGGSVRDTLLGDTPNDWDIFEATKKCDHDCDIRLSVLLHDIGKPIVKTTENDIDHFIGHEEISSQMAKKVLQRLKFDIITIEKVCHLINFHDIQLSESIKSTKRLLNKLGSVQSLMNLLVIKKSDTLAQNPELSLKKLELIKITLKISGKDIISTLNIKQCLDVVIEGDVLNTKTERSVLKWQKK